MFRYGDLIAQVWRYRSSLRTVARQSEYWVRDILEVDVEALKSKGYQVLILDYDGVLVSQDELILSQKVDVWLRQAVKLFGKERVFLLSNQPTPERKSYIENTFPEAVFLSGFPKKPDPAAINKVIEITNTTPDKMFLIDDRLWTGILLAVKTGIRPAYVTHPKIDWHKRPLIEYGYWLLRQLERCLCRLI